MPHQRPLAADHTDAAVTADLQVGARQAAGLPEPLQKAPGAIVIPTGQSQHPTGVGIPIGEGETDLLAKPGLQLKTELEARQGKDAFAPLPGAITGIAALGGRGNGLGIGRQPSWIGQPMEGQVSIPGHKPGRPRQMQRLLRQLQGALAVHGPEQASGQQNQRQQHSAGSAEEGAGLHGPAVSGRLIFVHHRRMAPWANPNNHNQSKPLNCSNGCKASDLHRNWWMCARRLSSRSLPFQVRCCTAP